MYILDFYFSSIIVVLGIYNNTYNNPPVFLFVVTRLQSYE